MIFSRDEHKHVDLLKQYPKIKSYLGDIRDKSSITNSFSKFKRPLNIPGHPDLIYRDKGWKGWPDFLGSKRVSSFTKLMSYENAKKYVRKHRIKSSAEFKKLKKPQLMPIVPHIYYKNKGWKSWGDFLGTGSLKR